MARRRAQAVKRGRPTPRGRGSRGPSRGRPMGRGRSRGRPTPPRGPQGPMKSRGPQKPQGRRSSGALSSMRDLLQKQKEIGGAIKGGPQSRATSRPTVNLGQGLKKFMDTMPRVSQGGGLRAPRGPMSGIQLANQNAMQRQMDAALGSQAGKRGSLFGAMGNVPQRPIPNRDGRMAFQGGLNQTQLDMRKARGRGLNQRQLDMRKARGSMPSSNYMRQQMPPQQSQNAMGRGPMPRANIGSVQAPQPNFNKQINQSPRGRRGRVIPRRR